MSSLDSLLAAGSMLCLGLVVYAYLGYPVLIGLLSHYFGRNERPTSLSDEALPPVSLLIAAHNEETDVEQRILNGLALDYPQGKLEIVIASDGSTDRTNEIVRRYADRGVRLLDFPQRRGKSSVLNDAFDMLSHPLVALSDANTSFEADSIRRLASWFVDPSIGVVCGRLILSDPATGRNVDSVYWKYETFLKICESKLGALLGSNGGIYMMRKSLFRKIPANTIVDDFVIPLAARQETGCRIIYDRTSVAYEETPESITSEFRRRSRIGAGGFQSIGQLWGLLHPRHGWVSFTFLSHKILRWLCPFFLIGGLVLNLPLIHHPAFLALLIAQIAFYAGSLLASYLPTRPRILRYLKLGTMFTMMNAGLLVGFFRWLFHEQNGTWSRTERATGPKPVA
jgi:cellulose synthase/poly-beta-1,6-N-acetylglucosamine synthase-like glycosyltransferase